MTIYEPNNEVRPTGEEAGEFIEAPEPVDAQETGGGQHDSVPTTTLLGVFHDQETAEKVARELATNAAGTEPRVGEFDDHVDALRMEMKAEIDDSWASPGLGALMTAEMARGAVALALLFGAAGFVVGAGLGFLLRGEASAWNAALLGALIGAAFCGTLGTLFGGGLAGKSPSDKLAAERGVTVRIDRATPDAERRMLDFEPIRLDRLVDGERQTVATEGPSGLEETVEQLRANSADARRQG